MRVNTREAAFSAMDEIAGKTASFSGSSKAYLYVCGRIYEE